MFTTAIKSALAAASLATLAFLPSTSSAATVINPYDGLIYSNVCQGLYGWVYVPYQPVGNSCFDPRIGRGYIAG